MSEAPWVKFFPSDWLAGTSGLTGVERGIYMTIICLIYEADGPVAMDDARLARRCGVTKSCLRKAVDALIDEGKISIVDGALMNDRCAKEIENREKRSQKSSQAAKIKWHGNSEKSQQKQSKNSANASPKQCPNDAITRSHILEPDVSNETNSAGASVADAFSDFWSVYPHKVGKREAEKAFGKALSRAPLEAIMDGLRRYVGKTDDRPWCNPSTFLNQDRWEDAPAAAAPRSQGQSPPRQPHPDSFKAAIQRKLSQTNEPDHQTNRHDDTGDRGTGFAGSGPVIDLLAVSGRGGR